MRVEGDDGQGQVVAVDEGDVVEGLAAAGGEGELGEGDGGHALGFLRVYVSGGRFFLSFWGGWMREVLLRFRDS